MEERRYAIYYTTPADHPLTKVAEAWLGRSAFVDCRTGSGKIDAGSEGSPRAGVISEPRRYGFHATLNAPSRLAEGTAVEDLEAALAGFANITRPCPFGPLRVRLPGGVFALMPMQPIIGVSAFAASVVEAPDRFRFHMTLTNRIVQEDRAGTAADLYGRFGTLLDEDYSTDALALVEQAHPDVDFVVRQHFALDPEATV
ncbi:DUF1045 domain-containing protein [Rhizobium laguerreae]|uniref:DUF1045 domain-containing protein n=1 Tax=Rhizobium laguerreae TaxID=1076926 RepID=UPI0010403741|nr:DUF1045 domain-containing protein [Rhizobium laguerreae]TBX97332.1 DUF1045 domain-containing protein [Rhizobium laguerreae]